MAHYAIISEDNIVEKVIVGTDENDLDSLPEGFSSWEEYLSDYYGKTVKRTSYNANIRKMYAGEGMNYDPTADVFYPEQPFPSWTLDENFDWQPPTPYPTDNTYTYFWSEELYNANTNNGWLEVYETPSE